MTTKMRRGIDVSKAGQEQISITMHSGVAILTLARQDQLNAVTEDLFRQMRSALRQLSDSPDCKVVVMTGEGSSFCAGMDLEQDIERSVHSDPVEAEHARVRAGVDVIMALREIRQPIIAAVRGHAIGAGFALAAASDLRFASPDARFGAPFLRLGVSGGDLGLSWFLPRIVGSGRASEIIYSGATVEAQDAKTMGLVTEVVDDPLDEAIEFATRLATLPEYGVTATKQLLDASPSASLRDHLDSEARAQVIGLLTEKSRSAVDQFSKAKKGK